MVTDSFCVFVPFSVGTLVPSSVVNVVPSSVVTSVPSSVVNVVPSSVVNVVPSSVVNVVPSSVVTSVPSSFVNVVPSSVVNVVPSSVVNVVPSSVVTSVPSSFVNVVPSSVVNVVPSSVVNDSLARLQPLPGRGVDVVFAGFNFVADESPGGPSGPSATSRRLLLLLRYDDVGFLSGDRQQKRIAIGFDGSHHEVGGYVFTRRLQRPHGSAVSTVEHNRLQGTGRSAA